MKLKNHNGGTIASRYNRFEPRKKAIEEINEKWGYDIIVRYYDQIPTSEEEPEIFEEEAESDVQIT